MLDASKIYKSNGYGEFKILEYIDYSNVVIKFLSTGYTTTANTSNIRKGKVKDFFSPSVYGVGFLGLKGSVSKNRSIKCYNTWTEMLRRCYCEKTKKRNPAYKDCTVDISWHNFQNFAKWFDDNYIEGCELDKDIRVKGNKIYGPDFCKFVTHAVNAIEAAAKYYKFKSPYGDVVSIYNLSDFCLKHGLASTHMCSVNLGSRKSHKGWTRYIE